MFCGLYKSLMLQLADDCRRTAVSTMCWAIIGAKQVFVVSSSEQSLTHNFAGHDSALTTLTCYPQRIAYRPHGFCAVRNGNANLGFGDTLADTDIHNKNRTLIVFDSGNQS